MGYGKLDADDVYGYRYGNIGCVTDGWTTVTFGGLECSFENSLLHPGDRSRSGELLSLDLGESLPVSRCFDSLFFSSTLNGTSGDFGGGSGEELALRSWELVCVSDLAGLSWSETSLRDFSAFEALKSERKIKPKIIIG